MRPTGPTGQLTCLDSIHNRLFSIMKTGVWVRCKHPREVVVGPGKASIEFNRFEVGANGTHGVPRSFVIGSSGIPGGYVRPTPRGLESVLAGSSPGHMHARSPRITRPR